MSTQVPTVPINAPTPQNENEAPTAISLALVEPFNAARVSRPMQSVLLLAIGKQIKITHLIIQKLAMIMRTQRDHRVRNQDQEGKEAKRQRRNTAGRWFVSKGIDPIDDVGSSKRDSRWSKK